MKGTDNRFANEIALQPEPIQEIIATYVEELRRNPNEVQREALINMVYALVSTSPTKGMKPGLKLRDTAVVQSQFPQMVRGILVHLHLKVITGAIDAGYPFDSETVASVLSDHQENENPLWEILQGFALARGHQSPEPGDVVILTQLRSVLGGVCSRLIEITDAQKNEETA